jgi:pimeloyl-ACP methyl ester carboxylesterase
MSAGAVSTANTRTTEQILLLGAKASLCGVLARPVSAPTGLPIVLLNTGIIHRVGHHRMNVTIARRYAARGHPVVRFDFGGIGDSPVQSETLAPLDANVASIGEVCDWIETNLGQSEFILMGLCSGADHSIIQASRDPRIAGVVLIDPSIPRTFRFFLKNTARDLTRRRVWVNLATGNGNTWARIRRLIGRSGGSDRPEPRKASFARPDLENPEVISFLERTYQDAVDNGARILAIFTGGHTFQHNYRRQILDALPRVDFGKQLDLHYYADCDHTFTYERHRSRLLAELDRWIAKLASADRKPNKAQRKSG